MSHQVIFRVDRFTKIVLVVIALFLGILVFKPYFESREVVAEQADKVTVYFGNGLGLENSMYPDFPDIPQSFRVKVEKK